MTKYLANFRESLVLIFLATWMPWGQMRVWSQLIRAAFPHYNPNQVLHTFYVYLRLGAFLFFVIDSTRQKSRYFNTRWHSLQCFVLIRQSDSLQLQTIDVTHRVGTRTNTNIGVVVAVLRKSIIQVLVCMPAHWYGMLKWMCCTVKRIIYCSIFYCTFRIAEGKKGYHCTNNHFLYLFVGLYLVLFSTLSSVGSRKFCGLTSRVI